MSFRITRNENNYARFATIRFPAKTLTTPAFFPSVSSFATDKAVNYVKFLVKLGHRYMLISAYDYFHHFEPDPELVKNINHHSATGKFLFVDSGGYEQRWNDDQGWNFNLYKKTISNVNADFYCSLDNADTVSASKNKFKNIIDSYAILRDSQFVPIFDGNSTENLVKNIKDFLTNNKQYGLRFIAVRERDLGTTLTEKAIAIFNIRQTIDEYGNDQMLHILGCGHPLSIAVFCYCGADIFDSRDWYLKTIDIANLLQHDFSHLELLNCKCKACQSSKKNKLNSYVATVYHNINAYIQLINLLQRNIKRNKLQQLLLKRGIPRELLSKVST